MTIESAGGRGGGGEQQRGEAWAGWKTKETIKAGRAGRAEAAVTLSWEKLRSQTNYKCTFLWRHAQTARDWPRGAVSGAGGPCAPALTQHGPCRDLPTCAGVDGVQGWVVFGCCWMSLTFLFREGIEDKVRMATVGEGSVCPAMGCHRGRPRLPHGLVQSEGTLRRLPEHSQQGLCS